MLKCFKKINKKDTGVFAAGLLFGTAGIYAEAQQINEERAAKDAEEYTDVEDVEEAEETAEEASEENEAK